MKIHEFVTLLNNTVEDKQLEGLISGDNFPILFSSSPGSTMVILEQSGLFKYSQEADQIEMLYKPGTLNLRPCSELSHGGGSPQNEDISLFYKSNFNSSVQINSFQKKISGLTDRQSMKCLLLDLIPFIKTSVNFSFPKCFYFEINPVIYPDSLEEKAPIRKRGLI